MLESLYRALRDHAGLSAFFSALLGVGIAAMLRPACTDGCLLVRGPPVKSIQGRVFQYGDACVEFVPRPVRCPDGRDGSAAPVPAGPPPST